jgi:membrane associated rhomboid family serine protease
VFTSLLVLIFIGGYAVYVMTPDERLKAWRSVEDKLWMANDAAAKVRAQDEPFRAVLRARTPKPIVVPAIITLNLFVFTAMLFSSRSFADPSLLIDWGANFGPRTSNGEWWRLATALFVHAGFVHVVVMTVAVAQVGITLERMLGPAAIAAVYASAGLLSSLERVSSHPLDINAGAAAPVLGLYGLMGATLLWNALYQKQGVVASAVAAEPSTAQETLNLRGIVAPLDDHSASIGDAALAPSSAAAVIPMKTLVRMAPAAGFFALYTLATGFGTPELAALLSGVICGLVFARQSAVQSTPPVQAAAAFAVTAVIILASAAMLRGIADVRPELARVVELETSTAGTYEKAVVQFRKGALTAQALEKVITQTIVPELRQAHARIKAVSGVPAQHRPLVADAEEYFRLRDESWRLRADGLRKSNMGALRAADRSERASLEALGRIRPVEAKDETQNIGK